MSDTTALSDIDALLYELRGPVQELYPKDHVLMAEWHGVGQEDPSAGRVTPDSNGSLPSDNRDIFSGNKVRVPLDLHQLQAGGWVSETGTVNEPIAPEFTKAEIVLKKFVQPIAITIEADEDSASNSALQATARLVAKARQALANHVNNAMNGGGDGKLASGAAHAGQTTGLSLILSAAAPDTIYVGQVVDVLVAADGTDPGQGKRRKITAISTDRLTLTFSTTQQASDGGSGNITLTASDVAVYVAGSYGNVMQGGVTAAANFSKSDTFENVSRATYPQFAGADGRNGTVTTAALTQQMLDAGTTIYGPRQGGFDWDFGVGDPNPINVFKASFYSVMHYNPETKTLPSGFKGIVYSGTGQDIPLVPERKFKAGCVRLLRRDAATIYGRKAGPDWDRMTGSQWQRFNRNTSVESWLVDRLEWGWHAPNTILSFENLSTS